MRSLLLLLFCLAASLSGQTLDLSRFQNGSTSLVGRWKFHAGDDPRWADPNFDDSDWKLAPVPLSLNQQGYPDFSGYGWYRLTLQRPSQDAPPDLSLGVMAITNVAEFYANGVSVGRFGEFPPHARVYDPRPLSFRIPPERWRGNRLVLAVRLWVDNKLVFWKPQGSTNAPETEAPAPVIGTSVSVANLIAAHQRVRELSQLPGELIKCAELVLALYLLGLYFTESRRPEYLWLGINFAGDVVFWVSWWISGSTFLLTAHVDYLLHWLLTPVMFTTGYLGIWAACEEKIGSLIKILIAGYFLHALSRIVISECGFPSAWLKYNDLAGLALYPLGSCVALIFLLRQAWSKTGEIRWFALSWIPFAATILVRHIPVVARHINPAVSDLLNTTALAFGFTVVAIGFVLLHRAGRLRSERDRLHAEMLAAQQIQKLLLPAQAVTVPGLQIEAVYLPAQEVGGDFFQISQTDDGSLLLLVGDVSGKGLKAALTVSLVVGLWREMAIHHSSPADVLTRLNQHLAGTVQGGFVTCLCARLQPDGQLTIANAGHLAPYRNGTELATKNGLPLGIVAPSEYEESQHRLAAQDTLVFVSDGVVEARDPNRNLFGFERLQQVLIERPSADTIAHRAQQFGQDDDITVITISRQAMETKPVLPAQAAAV